VKGGADDAQYGLTLTLDVASDPFLSRQHTRALFTNARGVKLYKLVEKRKGLTCVPFLPCDVCEMAGAVDDDNSTSREKGA
jgi:hypothetical protein